MASWPTRSTIRCMAGRIERRWPILAVVVACGGSLDTTLGDASDDGGGTDSTVGDAGEPDATVSPCGKGEVLCGNTCYPDDVDHCGPACAQCGAPTNGVATCDGKICGFTCNVLQCGSTCVDPSKDSHNCGACGHDCLATQCSGGQCQPELLYGIGGINYLAGDAVNLYWTGPGGVLQGPKGGGTAKSILSSKRAAAHRRRLKERLCRSYHHGLHDRLRSDRRWNVHAAHYVDRARHESRARFAVSVFRQSGPSTHNFRSPTRRG